MNKGGRFWGHSGGGTYKNGPGPEGRNGTASSS